MSSIKLYLRPKYRERVGFAQKLGVATLVIGLGFAVFILRLGYLQLISGTEFKRLSDKNRIRLIRLIAPRGLVYDCRGELLVDNRPSFTVSIIPAEADSPETVLKKLHSFLELDEAAVSKRIAASRFAPFRQVLIAEDVSIIQAGELEEYSLELPGIVITAQPCRRYPLGETAAQVIGYPGEVNPEELDLLGEQGYLTGDYIGKMGVELAAESWLRGEDGGMQVQVHADAHPQVELDSLGNPQVRIDTAGRRLFTLGNKAPHAGNNVRLTLDLRMQQIAEEELGKYAGAVVILNSDTGAIRALVSKPSYDPNIFASAEGSEQRLAVLSDPGHPLLNRALQAYPPGSTFKIIMAYAALSEGVVTPESRITCTGSVHVGRSFRCWKDSGHGSLNLQQALAYSCDSFFYRVGLELGIDRIAKYAELFGLGHSTGIDVAGEMSGLVPSPEWKRKRFRAASDKKWYDGETVNTSIGQGYLLATPLQLARALAVIVNGGKVMQCYLIESVESPEGGQPLLRRKPIQQNSLANLSALSHIAGGLREAVTSKKPFFGTAYNAKSEFVTLMGKTGTAQVAGFKQRADTKEKLQDIAYERRDHAWFIASLETSTEPLVIVALCEHGGHASESAVPIVRMMAERISKLLDTQAPEGKEESSST